MMSLEKNSTVNSTKHLQQCKICGGNGIIQVYRSDLEEFEEVECEVCNKKR
ncbi:MAG: hypothetical protein ACFFDF_04590 [Candidatus Odinarchaeota archaeon]